MMILEMLLNQLLKIKVCNYRQTNHDDNDNKDVGGDGDIDDDNVIKKV